MLRRRIFVTLLLAPAGCSFPQVGHQAQALTSDAGSEGGGNGAPMAADDSVATDAGQPTAVNVLANDSDPDGDALTISLTGNSSWPFSRTTYDCASDGNCWIEAYPHESGDGWFAYQACDPAGACAEAVVTVTIHHIATQPYAEDDTAPTDVDAAVDISILANDNANGGFLDPNSIVLSNGPWYGTASIDPWDGMVTYTPNAGYRGSDVFRYDVCNFDARCTAAYVFVFVDPTAPVVARADSLPTVYWQPENWNVLPISDNDLAPGFGTVSVLVAPAHGDHSADCCSVCYNPYPDYTGPDELVYQICTDEGCGATVAWLSARANSPPTIVFDDVITDEDHPIEFNPLTNDSDPDGDPLHVSADCHEGNPWPFFRGTLSCSLSECYFEPSPQETGTGRIDCTVCDVAGCVLEEVQLTVLRVPNPPECFDDTAATVEDTPLEIRPVADDAFNGGRPEYSTMELAPLPAHGDLELDVDSGIVTYTPHPNYVGPDSFGYYLCDVHGLCCGANVSLNVASGDDDPPAFTADAANTFQRITKTGTPVALRALDPDDSALVFDRIAGSLPDGISLDANGTFSNTDRHRRGTYTSTIRVRNPSGQAATTSLRIVVE